MGTEAESQGRPQHRPSEGWGVMMASLARNSSFGRAGRGLGLGIPHKLPGTAPGLVGVGGGHPLEVSPLYS